jgi:pimeloyl-ACP methyl ester carboxylesterase
MSTPPFIAMPDGVALFEPPTTAVPVLLAEPVTGVADGTDGTRDVLLVPGFTGSKEDYIAIVAPLAHRGWRVAAMDLPGQGGVPALGPRGTSTPGALARSVREVAGWLAPGRRVHLVSHSMGGIVAREFLVEHPESVASWTAICSGPAAVPGQAFDKLIQLQTAIAALPMDQVWALKEAADRAGGWNPPSEEVAQFCARRFIANDPAALADFADILMTAPDRTELAAAAMGAAGIGGAVITGELDDAWPLDQQEQMAARLGVPWLTVPGVGHNPATEDPQTTVALLDSVFRGGAWR